MRLGISQIFKEVEATQTKEGKIAVLRNNDSPMLRHILLHVFDPKIKFLLPEGRLDYRPTESKGLEMMLYIESRRLYLFVEGGMPNLKQERREELFVYFLENLDKDDAELMLSVKDKIMPYQSITKKLIREAYPGFLEEEVF